MSRIGLLPIDVPQGTEVKIDGSEVVVTGSKGELRVVDFTLPCLLV